MKKEKKLQAPLGGNPQKLEMKMTQMSEEKKVRSGQWKVVTEMRKTREKIGKDPTQKVEAPTYDCEKKCCIL